MNTREYWLTRKFSDPAKFPYGIARAGDFTISQSKIIEANGELIRALLNEQVTNPTAEDLKLCDAIKTGDASFSEVAKIWLKYSGTKHVKISVASSTSKPTGSANSDSDDDGDWNADEPLDDID